MALVDGKTGSTSARYEYDPFGQTIRASGTMAALNSVRFSSKAVDDETDLAYYGYRYLNPNTGRWLSRDPFNERGGKNLYCFVRNLSTTRVDPKGHDEWPSGYMSPGDGCIIKGLARIPGRPPICNLKWECPSYKKKIGDEEVGPWVDAPDPHEHSPEPWYWDNIANKCFRRVLFLQEAEVYQNYENATSSLVTQRYECGSCRSLSGTLGALLSTEVTRAAQVWYTREKEQSKFRHDPRMETADGITDPNACEMLNSAPLL